MTTILRRVALLGSLAASVYLLNSVRYAWMDRPLPSPADFFLLEDGTTYADGYAESAFRRIKLGMREAEVIRTLGHPLVVLDFIIGKRDPLFISGEAIARLLHIDQAYPTVGVLSERIYYYTQQASATSNWNVRAITFSPMDPPLTSVPCSMSTSAACPTQSEPGWGLPHVGVHQNRLGHSSPATAPDRSMKFSEIARKGFAAGSGSGADAPAAA